MATDFVLLEMFSEPALAIKGNGKIKYMNAAAHRLFGKDLVDTEAENIFGRRLLNGSGDIATGSFIYNEKSYVAGVIRINGFRTVVIKDVQPPADLRAKLDRLHLNAMLGVIRTSLAHVLSQVNSAAHKKYALTVEQIRMNSCLSQRAALASLRLLDHIDCLKQNVGAGKLCIEAFDLGERLSDATSAAALLAPERHITFVGGEDMFFRGDEKYVEMLLLNLLSNSIKHTPAGGRIGVTLTKLDAATYELTVEDTGSGIPPETQAKLFEVFESGDGTGDYGGVGLGLSVVRSVAEMHGGKVSIVSSVGKGTTVSVTLTSFEKSELTLESPKPGPYGDAYIGVLTELADAVDAKAFVSFASYRDKQEKEN